MTSWHSFHAAPGSFAAKCPWDQLAWRYCPQAQAQPALDSTPLLCASTAEKLERSTMISQWRSTSLHYSTNSKPTATNTCTMRSVGKCPCGSKPLRWAILLSRYDVPILYDAPPSTRNNGTGVRASIPKQSDKKNMKNMYKNLACRRTYGLRCSGFFFLHSSLPSLLTAGTTLYWFQDLWKARTLHQRTQWTQRSWVLRGVKTSQDTMLYSFVFVCIFFGCGNYQLQIVLRCFKAPGRLENKQEQKEKLKKLHPENVRE